MGGKDFFFAARSTILRLARVPVLGSNTPRHTFEAGINKQIYCRKFNKAFSTSRLLQIRSVACRKNSFLSGSILAFSPLTRWVQNLPFMVNMPYLAKILLFLVIPKYTYPRLATPRRTYLLAHLCSLIIKY